MFYMQLAGLFWQQTCSVNDTKDFDNASLYLDQIDDAIGVKATLIYSIEIFS